jgi:hypothetical protein
MSFVVTFLEIYFVIKPSRARERILLDHVFFWSALVSTFMVVLTFPLVTLKVIYDKAENPMRTLG